MKKLYILIMILFFSLLNIVSTKAFSKAESLEEILSYSNSEIIAKEALSYGYFSSKDDNKSILEDFVNSNFKDKVFSIKENSFSISGEYKDGIQRILVTVSNSNTQDNNKYISIFYSHNQYTKNIINLRETIRQMIIPFDNSAKASCHVISKINKKLSNNEISSVISSMLLNSSVSFNKDYDDSSVSFSGYTKTLENFINVNGRKINIQSSGKYSKSDNCTYIWIGNPIISAEY